MSIYDDLDFGEEYGYEDRPDNWNRLFDIYVDSDAKDFAMAEITRGSDQFKANIIKEQAINAIDTALAATEVNLEKSYNAMNMNALVGNSTGGFASSGSSKKQKEFELAQVSLSKEQDIQNIKSTVLDSKMDTLKSRQAEVDKEWEIYNTFLGLSPDRVPDVAATGAAHTDDMSITEYDDYGTLGDIGLDSDDQGLIYNAICSGVVCGDDWYDSLNPCCW